MYVDRLHLKPGQRQSAQAAGLCLVAGAPDEVQSGDQQADLFSSIIVPRVPALIFLRQFYASEASLPSLVSISQDPGHP
jgi:hypothetical protein